VIPTTLDGRLQREVEALARREMAGLLPRAGLAVLVVDHRTREVLAHLGAPDYLDGDRHGWIDMTVAPRSPGSALKPFVYGLALDDRVARPDTLIADVSTRFGDYAPRNFDQAYHGELTVREALQRSLNVPAVLLLDRIGPPRLAAALRRAGARLVLPADNPIPGLPLALGGAGITLTDLTALYAALGAGGEAVPLAHTPDDPSPPPYHLLTRATAREVLGILAGAPPPPGAVQAAEHRARGAIALKTGTSYGFRDAWALGVGARHTVGVWVGRPDGTPSPDHLGRSTAAPLVYRVFDLLPGDPGLPSAADWPGLPAPLLRRIAAGESEHQPVSLPDPRRLRLVFPQPGTLLERGGGGDRDPAPVWLEASGGRRPLTWLVDGRPLGRSATDRSTPWQPAGPGPARLTVVDAEGRSASAEVVVR
jgi:penicillin-binding protein 1C